MVKSRGAFYQQLSGTKEYLVKSTLTTNESNYQLPITHYLCRNLCYVAERPGILKPSTASRKG